MLPTARDKAAIPLSIAALAKDETEAAIALWRMAGLTRPWNDPATDIALALAASDATILAARQPGRLVGTVMAGFDGHRGWIYYLAVAEDWRGCSIGKALVAAAEAWLLERNAPAVQLMVRGGNDAAAGFYAALGYERRDVVVLGRRLDGK